MTNRPRSFWTALAILALAAGLASVACDDRDGADGPDLEHDVSPDAGAPGDVNAATDLSADTPPALDAVAPPEILGDAEPPTDAPASPETVDDAEPSPDGGSDAGSDTATPVEIGEPGQFTRSIDVDGVTRTFQLYVPQTAVDAMATGAVPMLFAFHGAGGNGANFIAATDLTSTASANAFVLVGPEGFNAGWFVQGQEGWPATDGNETSMQNDAELTLRIMEEVGLDYWINTGRVYAVGHSRGAAFVGLMAMLSGGMSIASGLWETPFAAYGINAGYDGTGGQISLSMASPKRPLWVIHGTSDGVVPYSYGADFATALDDAGWEVTFTAVAGATHAWLWRPQYGQSNQDLWDFLCAPSRRGERPDEEDG